MPTRLACRHACLSFGNAKRTPAGRGIASFWSRAGRRQHRNTRSSLFAAALAAVLRAFCWARLANASTHLGAPLTSRSPSCWTQFISCAMRARFLGEAATTSAIAASHCRPNAASVVGAAWSSGSSADACPQAARVLQPVFCRASARGSNCCYSTRAFLGCCSLASAIMRSSLFRS